MKAEIELSARTLGELMASEPTFAMDVLANFLERVGDREKFDIEISKRHVTRAKYVGTAMEILGGYVSEIAKLELGEEV